MRFSYSQIALAKDCEFYYYALHTQKRYDELKTTSEAQEDGNREHKMFENVLTNRMKPTVAANMVGNPKAFLKIVEWLKSFNQPFLPEEKIRFPLGKNEFEIRVDAITLDYERHPVINIVDFKAGQEFDTHQDQMKIYAAFLFRGFEHIQTIHSHVVYTRNELDPIRSETFQRGLDIPREDLALLLYLRDQKQAPEPKENWRCGFCPLVECGIHPSKKIKVEAKHEDPA